MQINSLAPQTFDPNSKVQKQYLQFQELLLAIDVREFPQETLSFINHKIDQINAFSGNDKAWKKQLRKVQSQIIQHLEKEHQLTPRNHYRTRWMALGMTVFGVPIGVAFGTAMGNIGLLGVGIPIGMGIGIFLGNHMDQKAAKEGRQLHFDQKVY